ncbi:MAG: hypothetical protein AAGF20_00860 [Pseudomonadota bacterium]
MKIKFKRGLYLTAIADRTHGFVPRWGMAPKLREQGIKALSLFKDGPPLSLDDWHRHGLKFEAPPLTNDGQPLVTRRGTPMNRIEAEAAATALKSQVLAQSNAHADIKRAPRSAARSRRDVPALLDAYLRHLETRTSKPTSPATIASYKSWRGPLDRIYAGIDVAALLRDDILALHETIADTSGLPMANGCIRLLRAAVNWAPVRQWPDRRDQVRSLGLKQSVAKIRLGLPNEMEALLLAADSPGLIMQRVDNQITQEQRAKLPTIIPRPHIGDALLVALYTTMREKDVLELEGCHLQDGRVCKIASKGQNNHSIEPIDIPILEPLAQRLQLAKARNANRGYRTPFIITAPNNDRHINGSAFRQDFAKVRHIASLIAPTLLGDEDKFGRQIKTFTFEDCRDTAITRMIEAGVTWKELSMYTTHTPQSIMKIIRHYLKMNPKWADEGGRKLMVYLKREGIAV